MMDSMKRMITGQGLEEESGGTGDQVARLEVTEENEKCERVMTSGNSSTEETGRERRQQNEMRQTIEAPI